MVAGLATLEVMDREGLVQKAERLGNRLGEGLKSLIPRYEFLKEVRWRGCMVGIEFGPPKSLALKTAWAIIHKLDKSLFPQVAIIPLLDKHHILTQVAGHHIDVVKLLPSFVTSEADVQWFLKAFEEVLGQMHKFPGPAWDVLTGIGRMALTSRPRESGGPASQQDTPQEQPLAVEANKGAD